MRSGRGQLIEESGRKCVKGVKKRGVESQGWGMRWVRLLKLHYTKVQEAYRIWWVYGTIGRIPWLLSWFLPPSEGIVMNI